MSEIDPENYDDWELCDLACARCNHRWRGVYSNTYKLKHVIGPLIYCPHCTSRFGVYPTDHITHASNL